MNKSINAILLILLLLAILGIELDLYHAKKTRRISEQASLAPNELRCDDLKNPVGIDFQKPMLTWALPPAPGRQQAAYQILVASSRNSLAQDNGDVWDSGKVNSSQSVQVNFGGKPLASGGTYFWKVRIWDAGGTMSQWSAPADWTMGLLNASDWKAKWIGLDEGITNTRSLPARWLRKEFVLSKPVERALVYYSGLGWSELYVNGERVGEHVLSPPLSQYPKREYYQTCELTRLLNSGSNALGVVLGNGRFFAPRMNAANAGYPKLILQLRVEFSDGTAANILSDDSWKLTTNGPVTANNEYDGEEYDARKEIPGWSRPGFDDSKWQAAELVSAPGDVLSAVRQRPVRVTQEIKPVSMKEIKPGVYIFDLGQNIAGWCKLSVKGPPGTQVTLRHAETLTPDGELYTANLRSAKATDVYILKGGGDESWQPRFTLHGFRYVEMSGYPGKPTMDSLTGCVVGDHLPVSGDFECSNPLINKIYHNIVWGVRDNYRSIPTDCCQRDERQGWLGDRAEESRGETYFFENGALYSKWLQDIADCQRTNGNISSVCPAYWRVYANEVTWASASVVIPGMLRDQFGDKQVVAEHYDSAKKWIEYMAGFIANGIITNDVYGDWCMPPEDPKLIHSKDTSRITRGPLLATPFFYNDLRLMQSYALQLGKADDAERYGKLAGTMKDAFNKQFFNRDTGQYDNGTPTSSVLPLAFDMVPPELHYRAFQFLVNKLSGTWKNHIGTGLVGGKYLMRVLSENGRPDLAYAIVTQTNYPGWGYMVDHDATTVWELWNGDTADPSMNSGNHVMLIGDLAIWMYENLAGIKPDPEQPGFKRVIMRPLPIGDLTYVKAWHRSPYGLIRSEWHRQGNEFDWHIEIPANSTATIYLPTSHAESTTDDNQTLDKSPGVKLINSTEGGPVAAALQPGAYNFVCEDFSSDLLYQPQGNQFSF
ncbi:MAG TPA: family 78 glycoside hydrolase catalytic domain [Verrucomicrobiae bacterium]|nr:family 78 glycoside hydrolase catalytic domain [Verrucomicrobiae bacterium]